MKNLTQKHIYEFNINLYDENGNEIKLNVNKVIKACTPFSARQKILNYYKKRNCSVEILKETEYLFLTEYFYKNGAANC